MNEWKFSDPRDFAVFTNIFIVKEGHAITHVFHDEDGDWQFHCEHPDSGDADKAMMVSLEQICEQDGSIEALHDLPIGCVAHRQNRDSEWVRANQQ